MNIVLPKSYGRWSDPEKPGNSVWYPDMKSKPERSNNPVKPYTFRRLIWLNRLVRQPGWLSNKSCSFSVYDLQNCYYNKEIVRKLMFPNNSNIKKNYKNIGFNSLRITILKINLIMLAMGLKGVRFKNCEPRFSPFTIATVKLKNYLTGRYGSEGTMPEADKILADRLRRPENQVRQWINENQYVWHERRDGRHIDLLSHDIHSNIPHTGGIAANKERFGE